MLQQASKKKKKKKKIAPPQKDLCLITILPPYISHLSKTATLLGPQGGRCGRTRV